MHRELTSINELEKRSFQHDLNGPQRGETAFVKAREKAPAAGEVLRAGREFWLGGWIGRAVSSRCSAEGVSKT